MVISQSEALWLPVLSHKYLNLILSEALALDQGTSVKVYVNVVFETLVLCAPPSEVGPASTVPPVELTLSRPISRSSLLAPLTIRTSTVQVAVAHATKFGEPEGEYAKSSSSDSPAILVD